MVEIRLSINHVKRPVKEMPRKFAPELLSKIKTEIKRLLKIKFIKIIRYVDWFYYAKQDFRQRFFWL